MYSEVCSLSSSTLQYPNQSTVINLQIKSNQITFIVTSPQHSALVSEILMSVLQTVQKKKKKKMYIWTDTAKKTTNNLHMHRQCKKKNCTGAFTVLQTVQKNQQQFTYGQYIFTDCTEDNVQNTHTYTQYT